MKLYVLKGFNGEIPDLAARPLIVKEYKERCNPILFDKNYKMEIGRAITNMYSDSWMTYEEFSFFCYDDNGAGLSSITSTYEIEIEIIVNNIYPDIYKSNYNDQNILKNAIDEKEKGNIQYSNNTLKVYMIYNEIIFLNGEYYVRYYNTEYDLNKKNCKITKYYDDKCITINNDLKTEYVFEISEDDIEYLNKINELDKSNYKNIGVKMMGDSIRVRELYDNFMAYLKSKKLQLTDYFEFGQNRIELYNEFYNIVTNKIKVPNFKSFRDLIFYKPPYDTNETIKINQCQIMSDMVNQAENAMKCENLAISSNGKQFCSYRDIFVTAPTGSGKSLIFQIPAMYLEEKYNALTIVITPLVELMNDQVRNLRERGYNRAEKINSSINLIEKNKIVKNISDGLINLLYLAPETLLSYSIDQLIGDRKIGLVIIDEAHIVSTWGKGFRPDYWYLGSYLNKLRKFRNYKGMITNNKKIYCFPICTFTATAVNGGICDDVNDIKNSLYLRDTITYLGTVKRNNIRFNISKHDEKEAKNMDLYINKKGQLLAKKITRWITNKEKTIVYFPYASTAHDAYASNSAKGFNFSDRTRRYLSIYTGGDKQKTEEKQQNMINFKDGTTTVMFATKAFGMGIDIDNIKNVYHYAVSGNLNDYVQEIGRVARSKTVPVGFAISDYFKKDLYFMKTLYGMSALHDYQVYKILSIIYNVYNTTKKYNLVVTPDMFRPVFGDVSDDQLEVKIKTALLTIEKDLYIRYKGSRVIITKPRNMFTECFMMIDRRYAAEILNCNFGKYFKKIYDGRIQEIDPRTYGKNEVKVTDCGDIFALDLKSLWEEQFSKMTFGEFKHKINALPFEIFGVYQYYIKPRYKITIKMLDGSGLNNLKRKLYEEIDIVSNVLNDFMIEGKYFEKDEFADRLAKVYKNKYKANVVANSYLDLLMEHHTVNTPSFCERRDNKYLIIRGHFRSIAESIINESSILKMVSHIDESLWFTYNPENRKNNDNYFDAINLAILFGIINFEVIGGNRPEIFIRINYPEKLRKIVEREIEYENILVSQAHLRHENDIKVLTYFFETLDTDEERWNFIENYYLGKVSIYDGNIVVDNNTVNSYN